MKRDFIPVTGARLQLRGLSVRLGGVDILQEVSLALDAHARTVVLGPNGAGKSTLLQAVQGLVPLAAGELNGVASDGARPLRFGFVFQRPVMLRRSARANVEHALRIGERHQVAAQSVAPGAARRAERRRRALEALASVGLEPVQSRGARHLSGGEQQRLAIARAWALAPDCLLLDEPTAHLDPGASAAIERLLLSISASGTGLLMTTHDLGQARRLAQVVVFLHRGRILEVSEARAFFESPSSEVARRFVAGEWLED